MATFLCYYLVTNAVLTHSSKCNKEDEGISIIALFLKTLSSLGQHVHRFYFIFSQLYAAITEADDRQEVQEYAELVGPAVSSRMLLFRSG